MYLVILAWLYVTLMMAVAEAMSPVGTVLGAVITFILYGVLPMMIVAYILGTPARRRARQAAAADAASEAALFSATTADRSELAPDADRKTTASAIASVREETR